MTGVISLGPRSHLRGLATSRHSHTCALGLGPRSHSAALSLARSSHRRALSLGPRSVTATLVTLFTSAPTGRIFNSRFSNRFKKS